MTSREPRSCGSLCVEAEIQGRLWGCRREGKAVAGSPATAALNSCLRGRHVAHSLMPPPRSPSLLEPCLPAR